MFKVRKTRGKEKYTIKKITDGRIVNLKTFDTKEEAMMIMNHMLDMAMKQQKEENEASDTEIEDTEIKN